MNLPEWWRVRLPREKAVLAAGAGVFLLIVVFLALEPVIEERRRLAAEIPRLRDDLAWMQVHVDEFEKQDIVSTGSDNPSGRTVTPALVEEALTGAGLIEKVSNLRSGGEQGVTVTFNEVAYAQLMEFLHQLQSRSSVRVRQARFVRLENSSGMVEARLVLGSGGNK